MKPGRDDEPRGVDGALGGFAGEPAEGGDAVAGESEVGDEAGVAGAVGDAAVADEDVVVLGGEGGGEGGGEEGGEEGEEEGAAHTGYYTAVNGGGY